MEQETASKLWTEYVKAVYYHFAYLTYTQSKSCEMPGWMNHKLVKIAKRNINNLRHANDTILTAKSEEELESLLMRVREESENVGLKLNIQKTLRSWYLVPSLHGKSGNSDIFYFLGLQNHCGWWLQPWNCKTLAPRKKSYDQPRWHIKKQSHYFAD